MTLQHRPSESLICSIDRNIYGRVKPCSLCDEKSRRERKLVLYLHLMLLLKDRMFRSERHCANLTFA